MIRLHIFTEGQSEEKFIKTVLDPYLFSLNNNIFTDAWCLTTKFDKKIGKKFKGGLPDYQKIHTEISNTFKQLKTPEHRFTTFFDLYALPDSFPKYQEVKNETDTYRKVEVLETAMSSDLNDQRFIPYIQMHEFEMLILCEPSKLNLAYLEHENLIKKLEKEISRYNPEEINEGVATAPSKRIMKYIKEYDKIFATENVLPNIELDLIKSRCPHFNDWIKKLEELANQ